MNTKHTSIIRSRNHKESGHGLSKTRIYDIWSSMRWRCSDKATGVMYQRYYSRGIRVCDEWNDPNDTAGSFKRFYDWAMANGYADNLTIDRIENDGPYAPWNCRWVTLAVQSVNKSSNKHIRYGDKIYTYSELSEAFDTPSGFIAAMKFRGYSINLIIHNLLHPEDRFQLKKMVILLIVMDTSGCCLNMMQNLSIDIFCRKRMPRESPGHIFFYDRY